MMTLDGASQQRRLATYGKAARRRVQGVTSENDYAIGIAGPIASGYDKQSASSSPRRGTSFSSSSNREASPLGNPSKLRSQTSIAGHVGLGRISDPNTNMFDVPSSEDESTDKYGEPSKPLKGSQKDFAQKNKNVLDEENLSPFKTNKYPAQDNRKRKRNTELQTAIGPGVLLDDSALQRHIAMEVSQEAPSSDIPGTITPPTSSDERHSSPSLDAKPSAISRPHSTASNHTNRRPISKSAITSGASNSRKVNLKESTAKIPVEDARMSSESTPPQNGKINKRQRPEAYQVVYSQGDQSIRASSPTPEKATRPRSRNTTPDHVRPISRHSAMSVTSPTQARLWNDLFPATHGEPSPSQLKMNQLTILDRSSTLHQKGFQQLKAHGSRVLDSDQVVPRGAPRKRLIDLLDAPGPSSMGDSTAQNSSPGRSGDVEMAQTTNDESPTDLTVRDETVNQVKKGTSEQVDGPKKTYARQRSYLTDNDLLDAAKFSLTPETDLVPVKPAPKTGGRRPTRLIPNVGIRDGMSNDQDTSSTGGIRSIHELRQAGGNKRYLDEVDAVLEDLDTGQKTTVSGRRLALMSLVTKFSAVEYGRKFVSHGLDQKLLSFMNAEIDTICSSLYCTILSSLVSGGFITGNTVQTYQPSIIKMAEPLLDFERSIVAIGKDRRNNMSKAAQNQLAEVVFIIADAHYWDGKVPDVASPFILALKCIDVVMRKTREVSEGSQVLSPATLRKLTELLRTISQEATSPTQNDLVKIELIMSILESHTLLCNDELTREALNSSLLPGIAACLPSILEVDENIHKNLQWLALRLTVNATSNGTLHSNLSEQPELTRALTSNVLRKFDALFGCIEQQDREFARDSLIISLASLINLTEWSENARLWLSSDGDGKATPLSALLDIFSQKLDTTSEAYSMEEVESNIPFGYLAVLLGNLCKEDAIRLQVKHQLPGKSLNTLIDTISEFLKHHQTVENQIDDPEGSNTQDGLTDKLRVVVRRLRSMEDYS